MMADIDGSSLEEIKMAVYKKSELQRQIQLYAYF
jgi:chemotaxis methyl-accepting protein methylase